MTTRAEPLKVLVVTLALALAASLLVLVGPLTNKALSQTTPSGTIDANTLPANDDDTAWGIVGGPSFGGTGARSAQTFTALNSGEITSAQVYLYRQSPFTTDVTVQIASVDALGVPTENVLATTTIPFCAIPVGQPGELVIASFDSPAAVEAGQQYALVLSTPGGSEDYYGWRFKYGDPLPNGQPWADQQDGPVWETYDEASAGGRDLVFAIYLDGSSAPSEDCSAPSYDFAGFFPPVDNLPTTNVVQAGRSIPVKFSLGGDKGLDIFAAGYPHSGTIPADPNSPLDNIEQTVTAGASSLSYDATSGQYIYVWKTEEAWSGQTRQLVLKLTDGSEHTANFQFR
jgi:hypothetical protein